MENIGLGLMLMIVGMITVFIILLVVIYGSEFIISVINRLSAGAKPGISTVPDVDPETRAVLEDAVSQITGGKGKITGITRLD